MMFPVFLLMYIIHILPGFSPVSLGNWAKHVPFYTNRPADLPLLGQ
jgi:hypothetical protein